MRQTDYRILDRGGVKERTFFEVMVSTDSQKIAQIAQEYGASVPFMRSAKTADDYATTSDVIMEVMDNYKKLGRTFEYICCIYPTAPFVTAQKAHCGTDDYGRKTSCNGNADDGVFLSATEMLCHE